MPEVSTSTDPNDNIRVEYTEKRIQEHDFVDVLVQRLEELGFVVEPVVESSRTPSFMRQMVSGGMLHGRRYNTAVKLKF